ncbi:MAG: outer membrane beta-barrel protein [Prevotella sp.]|nr:outer membrane beta-barrel protein [Prevotella sp.]
MNKLKCVALATVFSGNVAFAGGILTNTNQSISFLRNPARDAAIGLDGVYSNPAGVAFLNEGFHLGFNWQYAHQTRTILSTNPVFALGRKNQGATVKEFEGVADAPCIPSIQAAYNKGNWSFQFNFSVPGGGGKCEFADGLGSFESVVGTIAQKFMTLDGFASQLNTATTQFTPLYTALGKEAPSMIPTTGVCGYDMDGFMQGRQYYFGFQLGTAYKINENLSVYGGLRLLYGTATYKAKISNIQVKSDNGYVDFGNYLPHVTAQATQDASVASSHIALLNQAEQAGIPMTEEMKNAKTALSNGLASLQGGQEELNTLAKYSQGVNLLCNQSSVGIAPIIGIDYKTGRFNFAAKYEFKTQIRMKNESTVFEASEIAAVNKFRDGEEVNEDAPALLTVGAQWTPIDNVRLNVGYHHYFDKSASWYNNTQKLLDHDTNEYLAGAEWDINDKFTVSAGAQLTRYGLTDAYMNDMSFVVNSYSLGFGFEYKMSEHVKLSAAYFQTNYSDYDRVTSVEPRISDSFTRTNQVLGVGCELTF